MILMAESDNDDDACFEIPTITPIRSAAVIPSSGNQGRDSKRKGIMTDATVASLVDASRPWPSSGLLPHSKISPEMPFIETFSLFLLVLIMPSILKVVLLETVSLVIRSGMLHTSILL
nr:hypothetical protein [Tanacetum cinerariifolium]